MLASLEVATWRFVCRELAVLEWANLVKMHTFVCLSQWLTQFIFLMIFDLRRAKCNYFQGNIFLWICVLFHVSFPQKGRCSWLQGEGTWQRQETAEEGTWRVTRISFIPESASAVTFLAEVLPKRSNFATSTGLCAVSLTVVLELRVS